MLRWLPTIFKMLKIHSKEVFLLIIQKLCLLYIEEQSKCWELVTRSIVRVYGRQGGWGGLAISGCTSLSFSPLPRTGAQAMVAHEVATSLRAHLRAAIALILV